MELTDRQRANRDYHARNSARISARKAMGYKSRTGKETPTQKAIRLEKTLRRIAKITLQATVRQLATQAVTP